jgi:hypothetical protein
MRRSIPRSILYGGIVAGTVDVGAAALIYGLSPVVILHAIASGVLGKASFSGGSSSAVLGLLLQWVIGILAASVYGLAALRFPILLERWVAGGIGHGIGTFIVMNYFVAPLSNAWPPRPFTLEGALHKFTAVKFVENLIAMFVFGWIIAWFAHRYLPRRAG